MSTYTPDCWVILEIDTPTHGKIYKVLASWYGGYLNGDSWKISSGNEGLMCEGGMYTIPQHSGSTYVLNERDEGMSGIMLQILSSYIEQSKDKPGVSIKRITMEEYKKVVA